MCAIYRAMEEGAADRILVAMIAEILLVCAATLGFFVQFNLPISVATGGAIAVLFIGSVFCWKSPLAANAILAISLLAVEIMLTLRFPILMLPFALVDIVLVMVLAGGYHTGNQARAE